MDENLSEKEVRYDNMYSSILQNEGKIEEFLDTVFKFLYRKTDFFLIQETPTQTFGFPNGYSKEIILKIFEKYNKSSKEKLKQKISSESTVRLNETPMKQNKPVQSEVKQENTVQKLEKPVESKENIDNSLKKQQEFFQACPESYNGAIRDNYSWTQSIKDIDIKVKVDSKIQKCKDLKVKIDKQHLKIEYNKNGEWAQLIDENLAWKIKPDESIWSLFPGDHIHVNLEKIDERWWENLLENEVKLDLKNMNPEKPMHDLEPEAQAKIQQLMYDQQRKQLGLPSSEEEKYQELLKKAWNAEGSPFKGTQFDSSKVNIKDGNISINQ